MMIPLLLLPLLLHRNLSLHSFLWFGLDKKRPGVHSVRCAQLRLSSTEDSLCIRGDTIILSAINLITSVFDVVETGKIAPDLSQNCSKPTCNLFKRPIFTLSPPFLVTMMLESLIGSQTIGVEKKRTTSDLKQVSLRGTRVVNMHADFRHEEEDAYNSRPQPQGRRGLPPMIGRQY